MPHVRKRCQTNEEQCMVTLEQKDQVFLVMQ